MDSKHRKKPPREDNKQGEKEEGYEDSNFLMNALNIVTFEFLYPNHRWITLLTPFNFGDKTKPNQS